MKLLIPLFALIIFSGCLSQAATNEERTGFENIEFSKSHFWNIDESSSHFEIEFRNTSNKDFLLDFTTLQFFSENGEFCRMTTRKTEIGEKIAKEVECITGNCDGLKYLTYVEQPENINPREMPLKAGEWFSTSGNLKGPNCGKISNPYKFTMNFTMQDSEQNLIQEKGTLTGNWG